MEDDPDRKKISKEDNLTGRRPHRKKTSQEDNIHEENALARI